MWLYTSVATAEFAPYPGVIISNKVGQVQQKKTLFYKGNHTIKSGLTT
jgi:hypothetical protein